jgi:hypothetical protein
MRRIFFYTSTALFLAALTAIPAGAQQQNHTLIVNGQPSQVPVVQINGRSYADLEGLAKATNGTLVIKGSEIDLSLPGSSNNAGASSSSSSSTPSDNSRLSREFMRAAIEAMSSMRDWHSALSNAVQNQYPISENWVVQYQNQASTGLRLASAAASTDADHSSMQLLENEFNNMKQVSDDILAKVESHAYISPDSLENNTLEKKLVSCGHSLANMVGSGQFQDDGSCR